MTHADATISFSFPVGCIARPTWGLFGGRESRLAPLWICKAAAVAPGFYQRRFPSGKGREEKGREGKGRKTAPRRAATRSVDSDSNSAVGRPARATHLALLPTGVPNLIIELFTEASTRRGRRFLAE